MTKGHLIKRWAEGDANASIVWIRYLTKKIKICFRRTTEGCTLITAGIDIVNGPWETNARNAQLI